MNGPSTVGSARVPGLELPALEAAAVRAPAAAGPATAAAACAAVLALGAANGGYFPTSWGWSAAAALWLAAVAVILGAPARLTRHELAFVGGLAGLAAWSAASVLWAPSPTQPLLEFQRSLVYVGGALAAVLLIRRSRVQHLLGGVLAGLTLLSAYALATRTFPERLGVFDPVAGYRLAEPLGYWNALGILAAIGLLVALGLAARASTPLARAAAAAPVPVLATTLFFTFSRGAWGALVIGLAAAFVLERRRLQLAAVLLAAAPAGAAAVLLASRSPALTRLDAGMADAAHEGNRLALAVLGLAIVAGGAAFLAARFESRVSPPRRLRLLLGAGALLLLCAVVVAVVVRLGGPGTAVVRAYDAFLAPPPEVNVDLSERLFSFSGNGRAHLWRAALEQAGDSSFLGAGAGSFESYWLAHRPVALKVRDAHSLYLETLAELGPVGLLLLLVALTAPVLAAVRARAHPLAATAAAAFVAFLVHAGVDWDWEMPAVTMTALLCGTGCLALARSGRRPQVVWRTRIALLAATLAAFGVTVVGLLGASAVASAADAAAAADWPRSEAQARKASRFAPWSSEPLRRQALAMLGQGDLKGAQADLHAAIARDSENWALWLDLARASEGPTRAIALREALLLNPMSPELAELRAETDSSGAAGGVLLEVQR